MDSTINLYGGFVVPPYGEAHSHNVEPLNSPDSVVREYLAHGIFYVKNPNNLPGAKGQLAGRINVPTSIDVEFANGGLTATGGHPMEIVLRNISRGIWNRESGEGAFYWVIDSLPDLERKWPAILAQRPDFIKTYLLFSEEFSVRRADTAFFGWKGLDPHLLPQIVRRAHASGLRVSTHIETAADFHNALMAGVDEINHLPGFRVMRDIRPHDDSIFRISEGDARLAGTRGTVVVTTLGGARRLLPTGPDSATRRRYDALHSRNLRLLVRFHVPLALGSDHYRTDAVDEALYLRELDALPPLTVLKAWCETTPRTVFPQRKIGALRAGYEASFLVLAGDPLQDMNNLFRIRLFVKQGHVLSGHAPAVR